MAFQKTFKALSDPTRRAILDLLKDGARTAGDIASHFDMTAATVSHHLSVLRGAGLISDDKRESISIMNSTCLCWTRSPAGLPA